MKTVPNRIYLYDLLPKRGVGAELGVLDGENALHLMLRAQPWVLHLVDTWSETQSPQRCYDGVLECRPITGEEALRRVRERFPPFQPVRIHQRDTVEWLQEQPPASLDWVYIDSSHDYHHTLKELAEAHRVVKSGGWICGHDYCMSFPGVMSAVDEFCALANTEVDVFTAEPPHLTSWGYYDAFDSYGIVRP